MESCFGEYSISGLGFLLGIAFGSVYSIGIDGTFWRISLCERIEPLETTLEVVSLFPRFSKINICASYSSLSCKTYYIFAIISAKQIIHGKPVASYMKNHAICVLFD